MYREFSQRAERRGEDDTMDDQENGTEHAAARSRRSSFWAVIGLSAAMAGIVPTWLVATDTARDDEAADAREFEQSVAQIENDLSRSIQRQSDLVVDTGAVFAAIPEIDSTLLGTWVDTIEARTRHPELLAVAAVRAVPRDQLDEFFERVRADPILQIGDTAISVSPPGVRPTYCLLQAAVDIGWPIAPPDPGTDYCASSIGGLVAAARDSGTPSYLALPATGGTQLVVHAPIYDGGIDPGSEAARRAAYVGSLATVIDPSVLFDQVLAGRQDASIVLGYDGATSTATFSSGEPPGDARTVERSLGDGWTAEISLPSWETGLTASAAAVQILIAGCIASTAMGLLLFVLGTSRRRALTLVADRTAELRHLALHDALTGLPNRVLLFDRTEQLLARARREGTGVAVLYFDLDGFKDVNDTLGHAAGDHLLRQVADRLSTSLRGVDTIARIGGDEFVVLVDTTATTYGVEVVAERLLTAMRAPFELDDAARPVTISASVGVAVGDTATADQLVRNADHALYRAKAAGRDRYVVFHPSEVC